MLRFAPSPTGDMHIGDLRVAILNYWYANNKMKPFIVRIEDTDKARNMKEKTLRSCRYLEKFALTHDSVSIKVNNLHMHQTLAIRLARRRKSICLYL